jgi:hypothetical protein
MFARRLPLEWKAQVLFPIILLIFKGLLGKNTLAYLSRESVTQKKKFCYIETRIRFDCIDGLKTFLLFLLVLGQMIKNFFYSCYSLVFVRSQSAFHGKPFQPSLMLGAALCYRLLALPTNIRLGWKGQLVTKTVTYYVHSSIQAVKSFITLGPGANVIKLFCL